MQSPVILSSQPSLFTHYIAEMRDASIQQNRQRFRLNAQRASEIMAHEISKTLAFDSLEVETPLGVAQCQVLAHPPVLVSILRAGLMMHEGFLRYYDDAPCGYISAYRKPTRGNGFQIQIEYISCPVLTGRTLILLDPMVATGQSMGLAYKSLVAQTQPDDVIIATLIASEQGLEYLQRTIPQARLFVGAVDDELTAKAYVVPGLGDAGDLAYGPKQPDLAETPDEDDGMDSDPGTL